jgi:hypothetical protein
MRSARLLAASNTRSALLSRPDRCTVTPRAQRTEAPSRSRGTCTGLTPCKWPRQRTSPGQGMTPDKSSGGDLLLLVSGPDVATLSDALSPALTAVATRWAVRIIGKDALRMLDVGPDRDLLLVDQLVGAVHDAGRGVESWSAEALLDGRSFRAHLGAATVPPSSPQSPRLHLAPARARSRPDLPFHFARGTDKRGVPQPLLKRRRAPATSHRARPDRRYRDRPEQSIRSSLEGGP